MGLGALPVKRGSPTVPMPGYDLRVLDEHNEEVPRGQTGALSVRLPLPPGCLPTLWDADDRFRESYLAEFPGYYKTADAGFIDEDGYVFVMSRTDDIINVAGHRLSTGAMEEVLASHPAVAECAVIGIHDDLKGQIPAGFIVLKSGVETDHAEIETEVIELVREPDRPGGGLQAGADHPAPAQDPLGQDPARNHAQDRRRRRLQDARDHRRSGDAGRNPGRPEERGIPHL